MADIELSSDATRVTDTSAVTMVLGEPLTNSYDHTKARLIAYELPPLWLPSGCITASDGFIMDSKPFTRKVTPGRYPIQLAIADLAGDERVAFALLRFSCAPVVRWEMAVTESQDLAALKPGEIFGYGVDSGTGCFSDPAAQEVICDASDPDMKFFDRVSAEMRKAYKHTREWVRLQTPRGSAALFSSGCGDGFYASYFGIDDGGNASVLITDFGIVDWPRRP